MNKRRLMGASVLLLVGALMPVTGHAIAQAGTSQATVQAASVSPAPSSGVEEDAPGFDCLFDGNKICGPDQAYVHDAWENFDGIGMASKLGYATGFKVEYAGTTGVDGPIPGYEVVESVAYPEVFHVFKVTPLP